MDYLSRVYLPVGLVDQETGNDKGSGFDTER